MCMRQPDKHALFNLEEDIDIEFIRDGNPREANDACERICEYEFPLSDKLIDQLIEIARDKNSHHWARVAALTILGQRDRKAKSMDLMRQIFNNSTEDGWLREYANTAIILFARYTSEDQPCPE